MSAPQNFRSAFHGFNREDVVHYLEYINGKHSAQVNQLQGEVSLLQARLDAQPDAAALEQERDTLLVQVAELTARCEALEQQLAQVPAEVPSMEQELEVYRRAERTERMARERSELIYHKAGSVLTEAAEKVDVLSAQITPMAEEILVRLRELVTAVDGGKGALKEALDLMATLNPNKE